MSSIVISETEIKVNGYSVGAVDNIGFEYNYLYYEPEVGNAFKIMSTSEGTYNADLNSTEVQMCQDFCDAFVPPVVQQRDIVQEETPQVCTYVDQYGYLRGVKPVSELLPGEIVVTEAHIDGTKISSVDHPVYRFDPVQDRFVGDLYNDRRLVAYYTELPIGEQLDAIWGVIDALHQNGTSIPEQAITMLNTLRSIKDRIPKE